VWYEWPQAKQPFDAETLKYIESLDPDADARMLRDGFSIREECIKCVTFHCSVVVGCTAEVPPSHVLLLWRGWALTLAMYHLRSTVRITGMVLKKGAAAGMTLYDIASLILRQDLESPSKLENLVEQAFVR